MWRKSARHSSSQAVNAQFWTRIALKNLYIFAWSDNLIGTSVNHRDDLATPRRQRQRTCRSSHLSYTAVPTGSSRSHQGLSWKRRKNKNKRQVYEPGGACGVSQQASSDTSLPLRRAPLSTTTTLITKEKKLN
ncbi:hypothetical protein E2C01_003566 [Portunus trituberculatus]|uniref:Uncharacterized protein n=1 Tax=Portunus trituberculatus TaxID=210409 RepID=A0A5B7CMI4_PORTR|nr:hypothetical protein [Portunus trituberculatus]